MSSSVPGAIGEKRGFGEKSSIGKAAGNERNLPAIALYGAKVLPSKGQESD